MKKKHSVDLVFALILFCIFAAGIISVAALGAKAYKSEVQSAQQNFNDRTLCLYITEKIRQFDAYGCVEVSRFGEGDALRLKETVGEENYITYIYLKDNHICELTEKEDNELDASAGAKILPAEHFLVSEEKGLFKVSVTPEDGKERTFFVYSRASGGDES